MLNGLCWKGFVAASLALVLIVHSMWVIGGTARMIVAVASCEESQRTGAMMVAAGLVTTVMVGTILSLPVQKIMDPGVWWSRASQPRPFVSRNLMACGRERGEPPPPFFVFKICVINIALHYELPHHHSISECL